MSDPQRLLDDPDASPLARSLLSSAAGDGPSPERRSAVAKKLGLAALLATTTSTSTEAGVVAGALWLKLGALLAVLGGIAALVVFVPRGSSDEPPAAPPPVLSVGPPAPPVAVPAAPAPAVTPQPPPVVVETTPPPPSRPAEVARPRVKAPPPAAPVAPPDPAPTVEAPPPPPPVAEAPVTVDPRRLAAEVAVLDRARAALRGNDVATALAALDEHDRDFADGALGTAAEVVRIEALIQRGDRATAAERARTFLTSHPKSPLAKRVHSLLDSVEAARKEQP